MPGDIRLAQRLIAVIFTAVAAVAQVPEKEGLQTIVGAIEALEGKSDPKCHATATRLENFMYGTPLTADARDKKVELQKALIADIWSRASAQAAQQGLPQIPAELVRPLIASALTIKRDPAGDVTLQLAGAAAVLLTERDIRQYSSIAYSLRAILAVHQEALLSDKAQLLPLAPEAVDELKRLIDAGTLGALQVSDRLARRAEAHEISPEAFAAAWTTIFPAREVQGVPIDTAAVAPGELLRTIIDQKVRSYEAYNQTSKASELLFNNVRSFYARHEWPEEREKIDAIISMFNRVMSTFVTEYVAGAEAKARAAGDVLIRERHVDALWKDVAPFQINEYEDITYFFNLPREKRVFIEAYDADSFRDSGAHWMLIKSVIDSKKVNLRTDVDPFAAELLAEGTAQIGVLLYRMAGLVAKEKNSAVLKPEHVLDAAAILRSRMKEHLQTPPPPQRREPIRSASAATPASGYFRDVTAQAGIDYVHRTSDWLKRFERSFLYVNDDAALKTQAAFQLDVPPTFGGSGVAADDLDGDGRDDILIVGGLGNRLYVNQGGGKFHDVSEKVNLTYAGRDGKPGEPRQPLLVDFDNDGRRDIFISYVDAPHRIYRNLGDLRFEDVTDRTNLGGPGLVGSSATAFDFDRDGLLDLYISYYGNYLKGDGPTLSRVNEGTTPNRLFRNKGNFVFEDATAGSGADNTGWTQAAAAVDFDADGWQDLVVGNDFGVNSYYRNLGNGKFKDVCADLETRQPSNSMNVGTADLNRDGFPDIYISNIFYMVKDEKYVLPTADTKMKRNPEKLATMRIYDANHLFTSVAENGRLSKYAFNMSVDRGETPTGWAWDADFFDFDNDGDDDLYCVNGLNEYNIFRPKRYDNADGTFTYARPGYERSVNVKEANVFFVNDRGKLRNRSKESGADLLLDSRAAAYLDHDHDGDLDVVINNYQEPAVFLENRSETLPNQWLKVKLVGDPKRGSNRDAIGATITAVTPNGNRIWRAVQGGTGYLSDHPKTQHIGLGEETVADLIVRWPNGDVTEHKGLKAKQVHVIEQ